MYTPTVGEACQKFGQMPMPQRGMYISIQDRGNLAAVIKEYAEAEMPKDADGKPVCDCMVFSDGGRILGLGDLGACEHTIVACDAWFSFLPSARLIARCYRGHGHPDG